MVFNFFKKKPVEQKNIENVDTPYTVSFNRKGCIGAGVCEAVSPSHWKIVKDGKAELIGSTQNTETGLFEKNITESQFEEFKRAADGCPPNVIHIRKKDGEKII